MNALLSVLMPDGQRRTYADRSLRFAHRLTVIGETIDDAAGEAFDKTAKMLGSPIPAARSLINTPHGATWTVLPFPNRRSPDWISVSPGWKHRYCIFWKMPAPATCTKKNSWPMKKHAGVSWKKPRWYLRFGAGPHHQHPAQQVESGRRNRDQQPVPGRRRERQQGPAGKHLPNSGKSRDGKPSSQPLNIVPTMPRWSPSPVIINSRQRISPNSAWALRARAEWWGVRVWGLLQNRHCDTPLAGEAIRFRRLRVTGWVYPSGNV